MRVNCPYLCTNIPKHLQQSCFKIGHYFRKSDSRRIQRWKCPHCQKSFSSAIFNSCYRQKKRRLNHKIYILLCSGNSIRRIAFLLNTHRITVSRKLQFLAQQARVEHTELLLNLSKKNKKIEKIQFDELETSEHTKCKPIAIELVVEEKRRMILGVKASSMPAKGKIAKKARKKYGFRVDQRKQGWEKVFNQIKDCVSPELIGTSDSHTLYPSLFKKTFPKGKHIQVKGVRGCIVGQGELKKISYDPLFSLNHTCAMFRANVNRLIRRTWCTTKKMNFLQDHLDLYVKFHNQKLI